MLALMFVWLASVTDGLREFFGGVATFGSFAWVMWLLAGLVDIAPYGPLQSRLGKWMLGVVIASALFSQIIPKEKTMYFMAGAYLGQQAIQSEAGAKVGKIIEKKLENYLTELENHVELTPSQQTKEQ